MDEILSEINRISDFIKTFWGEKIEFGIILGSGLGGVSDAVELIKAIPYTQIPGWPLSSVPGHAGRLVLGKIEGKRVMVLQGRAHFYEGYGMQRVTLPIRVMQRLGIPNLIVTNAAGGVNPEFNPSDVMLINDHLNLIGMSGSNPLIGKNMDEFGPRFPDMSQAYDREFRTLVKEISQQTGLGLKEGVYAGLSGPSFETPADLRFLRSVGVDAVGMSTVPEVTVARHGGMRVLGLSGISNKANLDGSTMTTHEEVLRAGDLIAPKIESLIRGFLGKI